MNLSPKEVAALMKMLKAMEELYPGMEVTVVNRGTLTVWLTERPSVCVGFNDYDNEYQLPAVSNAESEVLLNLINETAGAE